MTFARQTAIIPAQLDPIPSDAVEHGEVFTRAWVVGLILDLADYRADRDLVSLRLVEPACGSGAFLREIAIRLSQSCRKLNLPIVEAMGSVRAFDLLSLNVRASQAVVREVLVREGWNEQDATAVAKSWVRQGDYLLLPDPPEGVDLVVGNPPYIRLEDVPATRMALYRQVCPTMTGRADIYVGFYETALRSLKPGGALAFICADRWMHNQYGRALRKAVTGGFAVETVIRMHDVDAFEQPVAAYPAITVLRHQEQGPVTVVATTKAFDGAAAADLLGQPAALETAEGRGYRKATLPHWFPGDDLWPAASPARLAALEALTDQFIPLGDPRAGVKIGIGVATGADKVFIVRSADVEPDRLLPLAMVRDTASGTLQPPEMHLVNPWTDTGELVDLKEFPKLARYMHAHETVLKARHVAKRQEQRWYRTIDKVDATLTARPKLLFPDMKLTSHPVLDEGGHYPHHNLYFVVSDEWDLRVLGGLMLSRVAQGFVEAYAVKMRGQTLRFQAQYLRRICVPPFEALSAKDREALAAAFEARDADAATATALRIYGLDTWPE